MKVKTRKCTPEVKLGIIFGILLIAVCAASIICSLVKINQRADQITRPYCGYTICSKGYAYYVKDVKIYKNYEEYNIRNTNKP